MIEGTRAQINEEVRLLRSDRVERTVVISARAAADDDVGGVYIAGTINDVTARVRAQQLAAAQTEILEMVALDTPLGAVLSRIIELVTPLASGTSFRFATDLASGDRAAFGSRPLKNLSRDETIGLLEWSAPSRLLPVNDFESVVVLATQLGALAIDRQLAADRMAHQATHDALSGLPNRAMLVDRINMAIERARRNRTRLSVMFLDVDRFKVVNDSLGHRAGD